MAGKPKPSARFIMQATKEDGEVRIILSYNRKRFTGTSSITTSKTDFDYLKSDGTPKYQKPKKGQSPYAPTILNGILLTEALQRLRIDLLRKMERYIERDGELTKESANIIIRLCVESLWQWLWERFGLIHKLDASAQCALNGNLRELYIRANSVWKKDNGRLGIEDIRLLNEIKSHGEKGGEQ